MTSGRNGTQLRNGIALAVFCLMLIGSIVGATWVLASELRDLGEAVSGLQAEVKSTKRSIQSLDARLSTVERAFSTRFPEYSPSEKDERLHER